MPLNLREAYDSGRGTHTWSSWKIALPVSLLLLLPCFWQSRIQSIDLCSHVYNAWLSSLIDKNQAPGLWIAHQSNNVFFDLILAWLLPHVGAAAAQKIAVGAAVLIFSWGAILLICKGRPRNWWFLLPSVAALSYGFVFHAGFFNFYLGLGFCFWYLAFFLSGGWRIRFLAAPLLLLAWIAHPLPVLWAIGIALYASISALFPPQGRVILLVAALIAVVELHFFILSRYEAYWLLDRTWFATGAKQLVLFGSLYWIPYWLFLLGWGMLFWRRVAEGWRHVASDIGFQLWLLTAAATAMIPSEIVLPNYASSFSFVSERLSLITAITLGIFLIEMKPNHYEKAVLTASALIFFSLVFRDAWKLNRMEDQLDAALAQVPAHSRVIGRMRVPSVDFSPGEHQVDRACIGHCFSYASYEPSTGQFRVRAAPGNPFVMADYVDVHAVEVGTYRVQASDLPVSLIYLCGPDNQRVCSLELHEGEVIGSVVRTP